MKIIYLILVIVGMSAFLGACAKEESPKRPDPEYLYPTSLVVAKGMDGHSYIIYHFSDGEIKVLDGTIDRNNYTSLFYR